MKMIGRTSQEMIPLTGSHIFPFPISTPSYYCVFFHVFIYIVRGILSSHSSTILTSSRFHLYESLPRMSELLSLPPFHIVDKRHLRVIQHLLHSPRVALQDVHVPTYPPFFVSCKATPPKKPRTQRVENECEQNPGQKGDMYKKQQAIFALHHVQRLDDAHHTTRP